MTNKQYISQLTQAGQGIRGKDVLEKDRARVIDGLCYVIARKDTVIAEKDTVIAEKDTVIAAKDADIARLNQMVKMFQRQIYGRRSEKLHPEDPNQLSLDFGEEQVLLVSDEGLKEAERQVSDAMDGVRKDAEERRAARKEKSARQRKGMTYRIPAGIPRKEPVTHYPEGYTPETMVVIGWNKHETLEIEKPRMYVRQEWDAICKPADAKPTDAHTEIVEAHESQNNIVERSIRPLTLGRKNWLFVDSVESARDTAVYLTLIGSCNMLDIEPYKYFMTILPRLRDNMTREQLSAMLPYKVAEELKGK